MRKYYQLVENKDSTDIYIYGDIVSQVWDESDVTSHGLAQELKELKTDKINVFINSYGGEVASGLSIYNQLIRHPAKVTTYCDGFACSAASVIFIAGDERIMYESSLLMIHNAWTAIAGNSNDLRKQADDLEIITQASISAYLKHVNITEDELKSLMDAETWISSEQALNQGFATSIAKDEPQAVASQSVKRKMIGALMETDEKLGDDQEEPFDKGTVDAMIKEAVEEMKKYVDEKTDDDEPEAEPEEPIAEPQVEQKTRLAQAFNLYLKGDR